MYLFICRYSECLRAGRSGDRISVGARFSAPVQPGPGAHPASCKMCSGSFPGVNYGQGVPLTTHPLLALRSWKSRAIPLPIFWVTTGTLKGLLYFFTYLFMYLCTCLFPYSFIYSGLNSLA